VARPKGCGCMAFAGDNAKCRVHGNPGPSLAFARSRAAAQETSDDLRNLRNQVSQLKAIIFSAEQMIDALVEGSHMSSYPAGKVKDILAKARDDI
jgi:hypothetical protein